MPTTPVTLQIAGMTCQNCVRHVRRAIESVAGVEVKDVRIGAAEIALDPAIATAASVTAALTEAGYAVVPPSPLKVL